MQNIFTIWLLLFACIAVIGVAGTRLSRHGGFIDQMNSFSRGPAVLHLRAYYLFNSPFLYLYGH